MIKNLFVGTWFFCLMSVSTLAETKPATTNSTAFDWKTLVGPDLIDATGKKVEVSSLNGKYVGIYCSAIWCPPCRMFTPELVKFANANKDKFAVVFYSADRSAAEMKKYMKEEKMPWVALPYQSKNLSPEVKKNFGGGIPAFVLFDPSGKQIDKIVGYSAGWKDQVEKAIKK